MIASKSLSSSYRSAGARFNGVRAVRGPFQKHALLYRGLTVIDPESRGEIVK
jgi:hypothetical protein